MTFYNYQYLLFFFIFIIATIEMRSQDNIKRYHYVLGEVSGDIWKIYETSKNSLNDEKDDYKFFFEDGNKLIFYFRDTLDWICYYDNENKIDSVVRFRINKSTTFYYKNDFKEYYPQKTIKDNITKEHKFTFDSINNLCYHFYDNKQGMIDSFDLNGRKVFIKNRNLNTVIEYNEYGYEDEEILKYNRSDHVEKRKLNSYKYDKHNNWIRKKTEMYYNGILGWTQITKRKIKYKNRQHKNKLH